MLFYVKRNRCDRVGWVGPIRSEKQAGKEAAAWIGEGWGAVVLPSSPEVRAQIRAWQQAKKSKRHA